MIPLWFLKEAKAVWEQVIKVILSEQPPQEIILHREWGTINCEQNTLDNGWDVSVEGPKLRRLSLNIEIQPRRTEPCESL
jgi:hypothetical protein